MTAQHVARRRSRWWWVAAVLVAAGVSLVVLGLGRSSAGGPEAPVAVRPAPAASFPSPSTSVPAAPVGDLSPAHLSIPSIGVSRDLLRLGLNKDRTVQVPSSRDADSPGWYRLGPSPGQIGSAVILGHVDSVRGPAVFYELRTLVAGDKVDVRLRDGAVAHFAGEGVVTYPNEKFLARKVYGSHGYPALQLVTCGGKYDPETGYEANVVVYTRLVGTTPS